MKALVYSAVREVTVQERGEPTPASDEVVLAVRGTGICGSDMAGFLGHSPRRKPGLVLGHEAATRGALGRGGAGGHPPVRRSLVPP